MHRAVARECRAVRNAVGMFDATTLGKIEVVGPDAAEFLDRLYTGNFSRLAPGRCRYGVLLNEAGFVMDDGVVARLAPDRFHVTTTTGGAAGVLHHMEDYRQTEFPELRVWLTSITEQWAVIAVQGPLARRTIAPLVQDIDIAPEAMPHMSVREGRVCGVPARLFRVSFTGELGYEINVPADYGRAVWEAVYAAGTQHGITAYGTETMHVLRAEKGYIIVGQETDGTVIPADLGLEWTIGKAKRDFVGKRSLTRPDMLPRGSQATRRAAVIRDARGRRAAGRRCERPGPMLALGTSRQPIGARRCTVQSHWRCWPVAGGGSGRCCTWPIRRAHVVVRVTDAHVLRSARRATAWLSAIIPCAQSLPNSAQCTEASLSRHSTAYPHSRARRP